MMAYKGLKDLYSDFVDDIMVVGYEKVGNEVKKILHEESVDIYNQYDSTYPNRFFSGESGSFGDEESIVLTPTPRKNAVSFQVTNDAKGSLYDRDKYLDNIIATGEGYQFARRPIPERPFVDNTNERLENENIVESVFSLEMKKRGWNIK